MGFHRGLDSGIGSERLLRGGGRSRGGGRFRRREMMREFVTAKLNDRSRWSGSEGKLRGSGSDGTLRGLKGVES